MVTVPGVAEEDRRQLHRNLKDLKRHRTECGNRTLGLLTSQGIATVVDATIRERLPISSRFRDNRRRPARRSPRAHRLPAAGGGGAGAARGRAQRSSTDQ
ncbi:MAG: hypothetical protein JO355_04450 [Planctomycetaceae bacterium]|nr:hypothetical protein [Planctomycetaceae bacterium]MBV8608537.1 hypothetical protein [Singulisphaera sp.]MBV8676405.1 hypothetical protein [Planctomycetaceae bacterium]